MKRLASWGIALLLAATLAPPAEAASGPQRLQRLAADQSQLMFRFYHGQPQTVSPSSCSDGQDEKGRHGVFLLPTLSFGHGDQTVRCEIRARRVLLDLGGFVVTEDQREGSSYVLEDGTVLDFARENLQAICDDAGPRFVPESAPAQLDGRDVTGTPVVTPNFSVEVNPDADDVPPGSPYFQDSVDLGHPGRLTACYTGNKALLRLKPGPHVIVVDMSGVAGSPTTLTYVIEVERNRGR